MEAIPKFEGQANIWQGMFGYLDTLALGCAIDLGIADILHTRSNPLSLTDISNFISPPPSNPSSLHRILRFLARKGIFSKTTDPSTGEILYGSTPSSKWIISSKPSLARMVVLQNTMLGLTAGSPCLSESIRHGGNAFNLAHGMDLWSLASRNPQLNNVFNAAMACASEIALDAMLDAYEDGFLGVQSVVDVGGGTGASLVEIVRRFPNIHGVNFDLPHVLDGAPQYAGISHVRGDMFKDDIPEADVIFMKWILHCFEDEECVKILQNCRKAISEKTGKLVIIDAVLSDDEGTLGDLRMAFDVLMLTYTAGKERTEEEWKELLKLGGFPRYNIIQIQAIPSIIEAYPE